MAGQPRMDNRSILGWPKWRLDKRKKLIFWTLYVYKELKLVRNVDITTNPLQKYRPVLKTKLFTFLYPQVNQENNLHISSKTIVPFRKINIENYYIKSIFFLSVHGGGGLTDYYTWIDNKYVYKTKTVEQIYQFDVRL